MALSSLVYLSDVENLSEARYAAGMGVDLLGFRLDRKDESSLSQDRFREIFEWISGVKIVGEFGNADPENVRALLQQFNVDYILVLKEHQIQGFSALGVPLILKIKINLNDDIGSILNYCSDLVDYFLLDSEKDALNDADIELINKYSADYPLLLGYGINTSNSKTVVHDYKLKGISLKGSPEIRPGYKDFDDLADILESLEID